MKIRIDHPKTRENTVCPVCKQFKTASLVICWKCYHGHNMRYGNPRIDAILDKWEAEIE